MNKLIKYGRIDVKSLFFPRSILKCKDVLDKISQDKLNRLTHNIVKVSNA